MDNRFRVLKWPIEPGVPQEIPGRKIVHFDTQDEVPMVWTECSMIYGNRQKVVVVAFPTGFPIIDENIEHVQSTQSPGGLVWHLYQGLVD